MGSRFTKPCCAAALLLSITFMYSVREQPESHSIVIFNAKPARSTIATPPSQRIAHHAQIDAQLNLGHPIENHLPVDQREQVSMSANNKGLDLAKLVKLFNGISEQHAIHTRERSAIAQLLDTAGIPVLTGDLIDTHDSAMHFALYSLNANERKTALNIIIRDWMQVDPAAAWAWIEANDATGVLQQHKRSIMNHWLTHDADNALLAINNLPASNEKQQLLADYAFHIANTDPAQAFYWASTLTGESNRLKALDQVLFRWASSDPEQALIHIDTLTDPSISKQLLYQAGPTIAASLANKDPTAAMAWTATLSPAERERLGPIAFQQWTNSDAEDAINWMLTTQNSAETELFMRSVSQTLAYQNLNLALDVFPGQSVAIQEDMASAIAFGLYQQSPIEAQQWTSNLLYPVVQASANRGMLRASIVAEPETALYLALEFDSADRADVLVNTALEVDQQHPGLLESWLITAPISQQQHKSIRDALIQLPD